MVSKRPAEFLLELDASRGVLHAFRADEHVLEFLVRGVRRRHQVRHAGLEELFRALLLSLEIVLFISIRLSLLNDLFCCLHVYIVAELWHNAFSNCMVTCELVRPFASSEIRMIAF